VAEIQVNKKALIDGFTPDVFATDRALELVGEGMAFRDAYHHVKENLGELESINPSKAILQKTHLGASLGIDWALLKERTSAVSGVVGDERKTIARAVDQLLSI
jgi:argininosuccinate lyase